MTNRAFFTSRSKGKASDFTTLRVKRMATWQLAAQWLDTGPTCFTTATHALVVAIQHLFALLLAAIITVVIGVAFQCTLQ